MDARDSPQFCAALQRGLPELKTDGPLPGPRDLTLLHAAVVGSRAYGLETAASDTDWRGVFVAGSAIQFGLDGPPAQLVHDAEQLCFWEVGKFVRLALAANPTVLETLYSPRVEFSHPGTAAAFAALRSDGGFLSQRAHGSFMGYADAQFEKMRRSRERGTAFKWQHATHLIRLLRVGIRLVATGTLDVTVRPEQRDELLSIKRGERPWSEVSRLRAELVAEFDDVFATTRLPAHPDTAAAEAFLVRLRVDVAGAASAG